MTLLSDRPNTALLVIDVQNGVVADAHDCDTVVANIATVVETARSGAIPVVWVQQTDENFPSGSEQWKVVPELSPEAGDTRIEKMYGDAFEDTDLEATLAQEGVGRVIVVGAQTDACVRSTLHGAFTRGYDTTLVSDAHTTEDHTAYGAPPPEAVIAHTNLYWTYHDGPGRVAGTVTAADVEFSAPA